MILIALSLLFCPVYHQYLLPNQSACLLLRNFSASKSYILKNGMSKQQIAVNTPVPIRLCMKNMLSLVAG